MTDRNGRIMNKDKRPFIILSFFIEKLWTAPELLRENFPPSKGTQRGDVYSYAIIAFETIERAEPYSLENATPRGKKRY